MKPSSLAQQTTRLNKAAAAHLTRVWGNKNPDAKGTGNISTQELVERLEYHIRFPDLSERTYVGDESLNATHAYDQLMLVLALHQRGDFRDHLHSRNKDRIATLSKEAFTALGKALTHYHQACHDGKPPAYFLETPASHQDIFNRMVLFDAEPQHYGAKAAPISHLTGLKAVASIWGKYIGPGKTEIIKELSKRLSPALIGQTETVLRFEQIKPLLYNHTVATPAQIKQFRRALVRHMLQTGGTTIVMGAQPDSSLQSAGERSDIFLCHTSFPCLFTTVLYSDTVNEQPVFRPGLNIHDGMALEPLRASILINQKLKPAEKRRMRQLRHLSSPAAK